MIPSHRSPHRTKFISLLALSAIIAAPSTSISANITINTDITTNQTGDNVVNFTQDVAATVKDGVTLSEATPGTHNVVVNNGTGVVDKGTLNLEGDVIVKGKVGTSTNSYSIKLLNLQADSTNASTGTSTFTSDIYAATVNFEADNIMQMDADVDITGKVTASSNNIGTLDFVGNGSVSSTIGDVTNAIKKITVDSSTASTATITLNGDTFSQSVFFDNDSTLVLADTVDITGDTSGNDSLGIYHDGASASGTITANGTSILAVDIGSSGTNNRLKQLNIAGANSLTLNGNAYFADVDFASTGTLEIGSGKTLGVTNKIETAGNNQGTVTVTGTLDLDGDLGASNLDINLLTVNGSADLAGDIYVNDAASAATGAVIGAAGTLTLSGTGKTIHGVINGASDGAGSLTTTGSATFGNTVGAQNALATVTVNSTGTQAFNSSLAATTLDFDLDGTATVAGTTGITNVTVASDSIGTLQLDGAGTIAGDVGVNTSTELKLLTVNETSSVAGHLYSESTTIANGKTLTLSGTGKTVSGTVTGATNGVGTLTLTGSTSFNSAVGVANSLADLNINNTNTFNGSVAATTFNFNSDGTAVFADNANLTSTNIEMGSANIGTLTFNGNSTVGGNVNANGLKQINVSSAGAGKTVAFSGTVYTKDIDFTTSNAGTLALNGTTNITNDVESANDGVGTITFAGTTTLTDDLGTSSGTELAQANINENTSVGGNVYTQDVNIASTKTLTLSGASKTVSGEVDGTGNMTLTGTTTFSTNVGSSTPLALLTVNNAGTQAFSGSLAATTLDLDLDGTVTVAGAAAITSITVASDSIGTVQLDGGGTLAGDVGVNSNTELKQLSVNGDTSIAGHSYVESIDVLASKTLTLSGTGKTVTGAIDGPGNLTLTGTQTFNSNVGSSSSLATITINNAGAQAFSGNLAATTLDFDLDGTATVAGTSGITNVTVASDSIGTLQLDGAGTIAGDVGVNTSTELKLLTVNETSSVAGHLYSESTTIANGKTLTLSGTGKTVSGTVTGATNGVGTLTLTGSTSFNSAVGVANSLADLNINNTNTFNGSVAATTFNFNSDGTAVFADNANLTSTNIEMGSANIGTLTFNGNSTVGGNVNANGLKQINVSSAGAGETVAFNGTVYTKDIDFTTSNAGTLALNGTTNITNDVESANDGVGTITFAGTTMITGDLGTAAANELAGANIGADTTVGGHLYAQAINFNSDNNLTMTGAGKTISGAITTNTTETGTLTLSGTGANTISGLVGASGKVLKSISIDDSGTNTFSSNIYTKGIGYTATGSGTLAIDGTMLTLGTTGITVATNDVGIFSSSGTSTLAMSGDVGSAVNELSQFNVTGGTLSLTGSNAIYADDITISSGATMDLGASRTMVGSNSLTNSGTLDLSTYTATLGASPVTLSADSKLSTTLLTAANGKLVTTAAVDLGGNDTTMPKITATLDSSLDLSSGTTTITIIDAGTGITYSGGGAIGDYNTAGNGILTLNNASAFFDAAAVHDTVNHDLNLTFTIKDGSQIGTSTEQGGTVLASAIKAGNTAAKTALFALTTQAQLDEAAEKLTGNSQAVVAGSIQAAGNGITNTLGNRLTDLRASSGRYGKNTFAANRATQTGISSGSSAKDTGLWIEGFAGNANQGKKNGISGYDSTTTGIVAGIDGSLNPDTRIGASLAYAKAEVDGDGTGAVEVDSGIVQLSLYGTHLMSDFYIDGMVAFSLGDNDSKRVDILNDTITASYNSSVSTAKLGVGMPLDQGDWVITPQADVQVTHSRVDGYTETGSTGGLNLTVDAYRKTSAKLEVGGRVSTAIKSGSGTLSPSFVAKGVWYSDDTVTTTNTFSGGGAAFTYTGIDRGNIGGKLSAGLEYLTDDGTYAVSLNYDGEIRDSYNSNTGTLRFRYNF
ncbi:MAG: autotransporter domain-containing protein [Magnetococcales bacterium]|nr:autotransporter domain-containing protein [Magnetococcales bacterium]